MKIYTKTGDSGQTGLFGGSQVPKFHLRVQAYGDVDELNSAFGLVRSFFDLNGCSDDILIIYQRLSEIQSDLFTIGSQFASDRPPRVLLSNAATSKLENWIDEAEEKLPPLKTFILPGGSLASAQLHVTRTICRRTERTACQLRRAIETREIDTNKATIDEIIPTNILIYLNRLSDLAFTWARLLNHLQGFSETPWAPKTK